MSTKKKSSGFTIVELLIVIVVIGILAAITVVAYNGVQERARDSRRKTDIEHIAKAIELYYAANGDYPRPAGWCAQISDSFHGPGFKADIQQFMPIVPTDPLYANTNKDYVYANRDDQSYYLYAELEGSDRTSDGIPGCTYIGGIVNVFDYRYPSF